jgi:hypothetical protein
MIYQQAWNDLLDGMIYQPSWNDLPAWKRFTGSIYQHESWLVHDLPTSPLSLTQY